MTDDFRLNLRFLCGMHKSVAEVCRRIDINRQQFNKYLGGQSEPSPYNMRKICVFFGVEEAKLYGPHADFIKLFERHSSEVSTEIDQRAFGGFFPTPTDSLRKYLGYYFSYITSPSIPNHVIKAITYLGLMDNQIVTKTYEKIEDSESGTDSFSINKYRGFCFESADMIYLVEREYLNERGYIFTALDPSYRSRIQILNGLVLGVSGGNFRRPFASQIALEFVGENGNLRRMIDACGCFGTDSDHIPAVIKARILVPPSQNDFNISPPVF